MMPWRSIIDETAAAELLWQLRIIVKREFDSLPSSCQQTFLLCDTDRDTSAQEPLSRSCVRRRTVSLESADALTRKPSSPIGCPRLVTILEGSPSVCSTHNVEHHDWSKRASDDDIPAIPSLISAPQFSLPPSYGRRKRETFVGETTKTGNVRATLKRKFSWKQYPELEEYLIANQEEYFEYSARNYTAEQRKYNNSLTRGLLELAASEGYAFEDFTFSMVRDRIRCYYKSHSQSAKKKRRR